MQSTLVAKRQHHVAILAKQWKILEKILDGRKTIETRWYKHRVNPWNNISAGDIIYFKESGDLVCAKADVEKVLQFDNLNKQKIKEIFDKYNSKMCLSNPDKSYFDGRNYCILIFLKNVEKIKPFDIDKTGFGNACAWLTVDEVQKIKKKK